MHLRSSLWTFSDAIAAKSRDGLYEPVLADSEREAVADLLQYLENVRGQSFPQFVSLHVLIEYSAARPISSPANLSEP